MKLLRVPYATWKSAVQAQSWAVYEKDNDGFYEVWAGNRDYLVNSIVDSEDLTDYTSTFTERTAVENSDDAQIQITTTAKLLEVPRTSDGRQMSQPVTLDRGVWHMFSGAGDTTGASGVIGAGSLFNIESTAAGDTALEWQFRDCLQIVGGVGNYTGGVIGDYVDFITFASATAATSTPGVGNANKVPIGPGMHIIVPAAGDGDWTVVLNDGSATPVPNATNAGYWGYSETTKGWGEVFPVGTPSGWCDLYDFEIQLTRFVAKVQLLEDYSLNFDPQNVHPSKVLPEWKFRCTLHNESGAHTVRLVWRITTARKQTQ